MIGITPEVQNKLASIVDECRGCCVSQLRISAMRVLPIVFVLTGLLAASAGAVCVSAPTGDRVLRYEVTTTKGGNPPIVSIVGNSRYTWVEIDASKSWPVPFVPLVNGQDFALHWEEDKGCLRVDAGGQDFLLGDAGNTWQVKRK